MSEDQTKTVLNELLVVFFVASVFVACVTLISVFAFLQRHSSKGNWAKLQLEKIKQRTIFNGLIQSFKISLFKYCITIGFQIQLVLYDSEYLTTANMMFAMVLLAFLLFLSGFTCQFLLRNYHRLHEDQVKKKCGNLYTDAPFKRDKPFLLRFPLLILHRLIFAILACSMHRMPAPSIQLLILVNLGFTMFLYYYRPCLPKNQIRLQMFSTLCAHLMLAQLFMFINPAYPSNVLLITSAVYIGAFSLICLVYLSFFVFLSISQLKRAKELRNKRKNRRNAVIMIDMVKLDLIQKMNQRKINGDASSSNISHESSESSKSSESSESSAPCDGVPMNFTLTPSNCRRNL